LKRTVFGVNAKCGTTSPCTRGIKRGGRNKQRSGGMTLEEKYGVRGEKRARNIGHMNGES